MRPANELNGKRLQLELLGLLLFHHDAGHDDWLRQLCTRHQCRTMVCNMLRHLRHLAVHAVAGHLKQQHVAAHYGHACAKNEFPQLATNKCSIQTVVRIHHNGTCFSGVLGGCSCLLPGKVCCFINRTRSRVIATGVWLWVALDNSVCLLARR